jgi:hypothetical protein
MPGQDEHFEACAECGATIYPEHLESGVAEQWEGKLLCPFCLREKRGRSAAGSMPSMKVGPGDPLALVEPESPGLGEGPIAYDRKPTAIRSIGGGPRGMPVGEVVERAYRRPLLKDQPNATRCRTFHCKLADGAIAYMNDQINEWADSDEGIEIKFATSCIGVVEGKHVDPHLIVTVFY